MMSCLWILVFGSLIATGVRTQEGEAEGSEEANTNAVTTDQPSAQAEDPAVSEDGGDGSPEPMSEGAESAVAGSEQDETTAAPSETADEPVTDVPEMDITTEEIGLNQDNLTPVIAEDPQGGEPHPTEGDSDLTVSNTPSPPEEGETKSAEEQFGANKVSAENDIVDADSLSEGAGKVRSAGAKAEPKGLGSGAVAGVVVAIGVAIIAAFSSYLTYQKKMLCFKVQGRDPERAKEENPTQNDPQGETSLQLGFIQSLLPLEGQR